MRVKFSLRLKQLNAMFWIGLSKIFAYFVKPKTWLLCERGTEARDNAYSFYRYMKSCHPDQKVYYLITKTSADFPKVKEDALIYGSIRSYWVIGSCEKIISAHYGAVIPGELGIKIFPLFKIYEKFYFLQHGIIKDDLKVLYADNAPMRLFVCGAQPEYEDVKHRYGHPDGVVQYTGLARFDYLYDAKPVNQILVMPTWRTFIHNENDLIRSEYFQRWQKLLLDERLNAILKKKDITLLFYMHYEMQKYSELFRTTSDHVVIAQFGDYDVQTMLKDSKLLITDYSSVFFDFAYMRKPAVYYQFDECHYKKGYFDYFKHGFGPVYDEHDFIIEEICSLIEKEFVLDSIYEERIHSFFPIHDQNNCERIYQAIVEK